MNEMTLRCYQKDLIEFVTDCNLSDILAATTTEISEWLRSKNGVYKQNTIYRKQSALRSFFKWASRAKTLDNPCKNVERTSPERLLKGLSDEQLEQLYRVASAGIAFQNFRDKVMLAFMIEAGVKASELVALKVGDARLVIEPTPHWMVKVGRKEITLPDCCGESLSKYLDFLSVSSGYTGPAHCGFAVDPESHLFPNKFMNKLSTRSVRRRLDRYGRSLGMELSPCNLRCTYARRYLHNVTDKERAKALGLRNLQSARRYRKIDVITADREQPELVAV